MISIFSVASDLSFDKKYLVSLFFVVDYLHIELVVTSQPRLQWRFITNYYSDGNSSWLLIVASIVSLWNSQKKEKKKMLPLQQQNKQECCKHVVTKPALLTAAGFAYLKVLPELPL